MRPVALVPLSPNISAPHLPQTAEKHDSFIEHDGKGGVVEEFSGKLLIQQEPDASSFPNGGIRNTFEARGYSAWDISSPAFILDKTLCIPTIFISYTGESLDYKTPLLKALNSVNKAATAVCGYFDKNVKHVYSYLGWEQEYFLVDESLYQADKYVSKAMMIQGDDAVNVCLSKAQIMLNLNRLDSASYFFSKNIDRLNIYGKAVCYDGMHQIAKKRGEWKVATENMDAYRVLYDSMQIMNDNEELNRLMDKHQLEEHKRLLSEHTKMLVFTLVFTFFFLMIICVFCFMWNDRKRKKRYIALQRELTQRRVDTMLLKEEEVSESNKEDLDKKRSELTEQQIQLCISVLKTTDCYDQLEALEKATHKQLLAMRSLRKDIRSTISNAFVDVMMNLKERYPALTGDDLFYCVLSLLCCSKTVMMELMDATSDALKTRKNRIKNKMDTQIFDRVFGVDLQ